MRTPAALVIASATLVAVVLGGANPVPVQAAVAPATPATPARVASTPVVEPPRARPWTRELSELGTDPQVHDVLYLDGVVWISSPDRVSRFSTVDGTYLGGAQVVGSAELAVTADGERVFAAVPAEGVIRVFTADDGAPSATWPVASCPRRPVVSAEVLLFVQGCGGETDPIGIGAVGVADGVARASGLPQLLPGPLPDLLPGAPGVPGAGPTLLAGADLLITLDGAEQVTVRVYRRDTDGFFVPVAARQVGQVRDAALAPGAAELLLALADGTLTRLETAGLTELPTAPQPPATTGEAAAPAQVAAIGYAPDGSSYATAVVADQDQFLVHALPSTDPVSRSAADLPEGRSRAAAVAGSLGYSPDGARLQGLVPGPSGAVQLVVATALPVQASDVALRLLPPRRFGGDLRIEVRVPSRPNAEVELQLRDGTGTGTMDATTDENGTLVISAQVETAGRVTASVAADLTHAAGRASHEFSVPAQVRVSFTGGTGSSGGVLRYRAVRQVKGLVRASPARSVKVVLVLQQRTRRGWRAAARPQLVRTDRDGLLGITMGGGVRGVRYRLVVRFPGDRWNTRAPIAVSRPWTIG